MANRLGHGIPLEVGIASQHKITQRAAGIASLMIMVRQQVRQINRQIGVEPLQRLGGGAVQVAAVIAQQRLVGGLLHQVVPEGVFILSANLRGDDDFGGTQGVEVEAQPGGMLPGDFLQQAGREAPSQHGRHLQGAAGRLGQAIHAGQQQGMECIGDLHAFGQVSGMPAARAAHQHALIDPHAHHFFHKKRIAPGAVEDAVVEGFWQGAVMENVFQQVAAIARRKRIQRKVVAVGQVGRLANGSDQPPAGRIGLGAADRAEQHRGLIQQRQQAGQ